MSKLSTLIAAVSWLVASMIKSDAQTTLVFTNTFDVALPDQIQPGTALLTGVQVFGGLGPTGNQFGNSFLRSATANLVTLTLSNLPPHRTLGLSMLFAAIDSLDGTGTFPAGDFLAISLDSNVIFRESFANASPEQIQSYVAPRAASWHGMWISASPDLGATTPTVPITLGSTPVSRVWRTPMPLRS
jgi:hypothetical protein